MNFKQIKGQPKKKDENITGVDPFNLFDIFVSDKEYWASEKKEDEDVFEFHLQVAINLKEDNYSLTTTYEKEKKDFQFSIQYTTNFPLFPLLQFSTGILFNTKISLKVGGQLVINAK